MCRSFESNHRAGLKPPVETSPLVTWNGSQRCCTFDGRSAARCLNFGIPGTDQELFAAVKPRLEAAAQASGVPDPLCF